MSVFLGITTCHKFSDRAQAQRDTWIRDVPEGVGYRFFLGAPAPEGFQAKPDEVLVDVPDDYNGLPAKTRAAVRWALENNYDWFHKLDDDVYLRPERLLTQIPENGQHYVGRFRGPSCVTHSCDGCKCPNYQAWYCSGFSYWLSRKAMEVIAAAELTEDPAEDRWVGNSLLAAGITGMLDKRIAVIPEAPLPSPKNQQLCSAEFRGIREMKIVHEFFKVGHVNVPPPNRLWRYVHA